MKCKACKREIPDHSIFCLYCGEKVIKSRKKKSEVSVPKPKQLPSGTWFGRIFSDGTRYSISAASEEEYYAKAKAIKLGLIDAKKANAGITLKSAIRKYIDDNINIFSPSTVRGYEIIYRNRFKNYINSDIYNINYQAMINEESSLVSPKTVSNAWALVSTSLSYAGMTPPKINKPASAKKDEDWLDFEQIKTFIFAVHGKPVELAALLALHGLRTSEFLDLDVSQITPNGIVIRGATVPDRNNVYVHKDTNKNKTSSRTVPILIPRVLDLLPESGKAVTLHPSNIRKWLAKVCIAADLPVCTAHDLRRSFASLAFHLGWNAQTTMAVGGWANMQTVNEVYRKLSQKDKEADIEKMKTFFTF